MNARCIDHQNGGICTTEHKVSDYSSLEGLCFFTQFFILLDFVTTIINHFVPSYLDLHLILLSSRPRVK